MTTLMTADDLISGRFDSRHPLRTQ